MLGKRNGCMMVLCIIPVILMPVPHYTVYVQCSHNCDILIGQLTTAYEYVFHIIWIIFKVKNNGSIVVQRGGLDPPPGPACCGLLPHQGRPLGLLGGGDEGEKRGGGVYLEEVDDKMDCRSTGIEGFLSYDFFSFLVSFPDEILIKKTVDLTRGSLIGSMFRCI